MPHARDLPREVIFASAKEVAVILNLSRNAVYELCDSGVLESRFLGRRRLILLASVDKLAAGLPAERESA